MSSIKVKWHSKSKITLVYRLAESSFYTAMAGTPDSSNMQRCRTLIHFQLRVIVQIPSYIRPVHHQFQLLQCSPQFVDGKQQKMYNSYLPMTSNEKNFNLSVKIFSVKEATLKTKQIQTASFFSIAKNVMKTKQYHIEWSMARWHFQLDNLA